MNILNDKQYERQEVLNNTTQYGEFISTYNYWIDLDRFHSRAKYIQKLGRTE